MTDPPIPLTQAANEVDDILDLLDISATVRALVASKLLHIPKTPVAAGVYAIINNSSRQIYIGSSKNIYKRLREHIKMMVTGTHHSYRVQQSYNTHKISPFSFQVLELTDDLTQLFPIEQKWMDIYSKNKSYKMMNISKTADSSHYMHKQKRRSSSTAVQVKKVRKGRKTSARKKSTK